MTSPNESRKQYDKESWLTAVATLLGGTPITSLPDWHSLYNSGVTPADAVLSMAHMTPTILQPPILDHDVMMARRFNSTVGVRGKLERRIVWNLLAHLEREGYLPYTVAGGDDGNEAATTPERVMNLVFNLDESCVGFVRKGDPRTGKHEVGNVVLIGGNSEDIVSDYRWNDNPVGEAFEKAMERFDSYDYV